MNISKKLQVRKLNTAQSLNKSEILLVGAGVMAQDYFNVLRDLKIEARVFCRSKESSELFNNVLGYKPEFGDLQEFVLNNKFEKAIIAVDLLNLFDVADILISSGVKDILIEKPAGSEIKEIYALADLGDSLGASIYVAYNRRFFSSVIKAKEIIRQDGGVLSFSFEFTEWSEKIAALKLHEKINNNWALCNSSHVIDLAFYLCGYPKELESKTSGKDLLSWHPSASIFYGVGETLNNIIFNYKANWAGPGRWGIEIITKRRKLLLQPLEELKVNEKNSLEIIDVSLDDHLDKQYKPGLYLQTNSFVNNKTEDLCKINEQKELMEFFKLISGYT